MADSELVAFVLFWVVRSYIRIFPGKVLIDIASVWSTCNWAVGSFVFGSVLMFEYCQRRRQLEMQGMKRAVEVIDRKQAEKKKKAEEARAARTKAKEES